VDQRFFRNLPLCAEFPAVNDTVAQNFPNSAGKSKCLEEGVTKFKTSNFI